MKRTRWTRGEKWLLAAPLLVALPMGAWQIAQGFLPLPEPVRWPSGQTQVDALAFSPDGKTLASGGWDGSVKTWQVPTGRFLSTVRPANGHQITSVAFCDASTVAVADYSFNRARRITGSSLSLWSQEQLKAQKQSSGAKEIVQSLACSPDGRVLAVGGNRGWVRLLDLPSLGLKKQLRGNFKDEVETEAYALHFSRDNRLLLAQTKRGDFLWEWKTGRLIKSWDFATGKKAGAAFSFDSRFLARADSGESISLVETRRGKTVAQQQLTALEGVAFSRDGTTLYAFDALGTMQFYVLDVPSLRLRQTRSGPFGNDPFVFAGDDHLLAQGGSDLSFFQFER